MKQHIKSTSENAYRDILRSIQTNSIVTIPVSENGKTVYRTYDLEVLNTSNNNRGFEIEISVDYEAEMVIKIRAASSKTGSTVEVTYKKKASHIKKSDFEAIARHLYNACTTLEEREERKVEASNRANRNSSRTAYAVIAVLLLLVVLLAGGCAVSCSSNDYSDYLNSSQGAADFGSWLRTHKGL